MKYAVQYTLPYTHTVMVGIEAESEEQAKERASELFNEGAIWDDTEETPLLYDDFDEDGDASIPLEFTIEAEYAEDENWPEPGACVLYIRRREAAFAAASALLAVYSKGIGGGAVDWSDLDNACLHAINALS